MARLDDVPRPDVVVVGGGPGQADQMSDGPLIDMALTLAGLIAGDDVARAVQLLLEYAPQPPYNAGTQETAGPEVVEKLLALFPHE